MFTVNEPFIKHYEQPEISWQKYVHFQQYYASSAFYESFTVFWHPWYNLTTWAGFETEHKGPLMGQLSYIRPSGVSWLVKQEFLPASPTSVSSVKHLPHASSAYSFQLCRAFGPPDNRLPPKSLFTFLSHVPRRRGSTLTLDCLCLCSQPAKVGEN